MAQVRHEKVTPKPGEATPGKQNFDIQQNPGALQAATQNGMSPLSLMEANKPGMDTEDVPLIAKMYPSAK